MHRRFVRLFAGGPALALSLVASLFALSCAGSGSTSPPATLLKLGTWGTGGAAVVVSDTLAHVHVGCTKGDFVRPVTLDAEGRFNVAGTYVLRAYPIQIGPSLPARFSGVVRGSVLTLSVAVDDTVEKQLVALGPVTVTLGRLPELGTCPLCVMPPPTN